SAYVDQFLAVGDADNRVHCSINSLKARADRMSMTNPALQTLPASESEIRKWFLADDGDMIVSVDYKAQELRALAALSGDPVMRQAFVDDADLQQITADAAGVDRKVGKMANFLNVYGGGPSALASQAGISLDVAKKVLKAFNDTY